MKTSNIIFQIIGFLDNYAGGYSFEEKIIQVIPNDQNNFKRIKEFEELCIRYFHETQGENDLEIRDGKMKVFYSTKLCNVINQICFKDDFLGRDYFVLNEEIFSPVKSYFDLNDKGNQERIQFVKGVYLRHAQNQNELIIYNDYNKSSLVHRILSKFGDDDDEIIWRSYFLIPHTNKISIKENGRLMRDIIKRE